jgi:two-component system chemotaxis response regulator CheV
MIAFRVQGVDRIHRVSWQSFIPLPHCPGMAAPVTGIILIEGRIVTVLDFEAIGGVLGINGTPSETTGADSTPDATTVRPPLVFADDSLLIRKMLDDALSQAGYEERQGFSDGQEAWEYLEGLAQTNSPETIRKLVAGVISDVEMPRMDGFTLTRRIRENPVLKDLPVVLFSSLISKDNEKKGRQVGATAQISKPRWDELTATLVNVLGQVVG